MPSKLLRGALAAALLLSIACAESPPPESETEAVEGPRGERVDFLEKTAIGDAASGTPPWIAHLEVVDLDARLRPRRPLHQRRRLRLRAFAPAAVAWSAVAREPRRPSVRVSRYRRSARRLLGPRRRCRRRLGPRRLHQEAGAYGSAVESERMREIHDLAVDAILEGDPAPGPDLLPVKCARCHDHERI